MKKPIISIGSDHAGFTLKESLKTHLKENGYTVNDYGTHNLDSVDYPDYAHPLAHGIENGQEEFGILICGSAIGVSISANRNKAVRAAIVWRKEIAALSRQHNNANVICLPARFISEEESYQFVDLFLTTTFEEGRHAKRVNKINNIEKV